jgi:hypothetical protein
MRIRTSFLLYIPLVTVLATGCTDQSPAPGEPATTTAVASQTPTKGKLKAAKRKPKDPKSLTGPTDVVD